MNKLREKALKLGGQELKRSERKNKKLAVLYNNNWIHFGDRRYMDFTQHKNLERRKSYLKRARGIRDKEGRLTHKNKNKSNFWAINILW